MRGKTIISRTFAIMGIACVCLLMTLLAFGCKEKTERTGSPEQTREVATDQMKRETSVEEHENQLAFDLDEISVFDLSDEVSRDFFRGQMTLCNDQPDRARPGRYPRFESDKPLYGSVRFAGKPVEHSSPSTYYLAIDESAGTGKGYDRLYFDRNCDLDLTNDKPLMPLKDPSDAMLLRRPSDEQEICFDNLSVTFDFGPAGKRAIDIMPRLVVRKYGPGELNFVAAKARAGLINLGATRLNAVLGYSYSVGERFDQGRVIFCLDPDGTSERAPYWWGADELNSMHVIGGKHYGFGTTPTGDKLIVRPYTGQLGTFEAGAGGRDIDQITMRGSLGSEHTSVAVGGELEQGWPRPARSCRVPVGDYFPRNLRITFGRLSIFISNNYHADGQPRAAISRAKVYGVKIREDRPYVLDFTNVPDVLFASPAKDKRVKLGNELQVKAVLVDPELDIMVRGLDDMTHAKTTTVKMADGQERTFKRGRSLDPKVVITRASGEQVAEGVMPFG